MVVCVCNAIREKDLRAAVRSGSDRPERRLLPSWPQTQMRAVLVLCAQHH